MKTTPRPIREKENGAQKNENEQVRRQMRSFVAALRSYPRRFAEDRGVSFEQHRRNLTEEVVPSARQRS